MKTRMKILDMPKLESPFVRKQNEQGEYVVTPEVVEGFEWVFEDPSVRAVEKLHGTNVSVVIENGLVASVFNRTERIPFINKNKKWIIEGLLESNARDYIPLEDGQHFGELIGRKVNGNPYGLDKHVWIPFKTYAWNHLSYKSWGKYPKTFESIEAWFKDGVMPLYAMKVYGKEALPMKSAEGVVFTHPDGRMAKLRADMFEWFNGKRHGN